MPTLQELEQQYSGASAPKQNTPQSLSINNGQPDPSLSTPQAIGQGISNIGSSLGSNIRNVGESLLHPIKTIENLGETALGAFAPMPAGGDLDPKTGKPVPVAQPSKSAQAFQNFGNNFLGGALNGQGYDGLKQKLAKDPVGLMLDFNILGSTANDVFEGVSGIDSSGVIDKTLKVSNPVQAPFETIGDGLEKIGQVKKGIPEKLSDFSEAGVKNPPLEALLKTNSPLKGIVSFIRGGIFGSGGGILRSNLQESVDATKAILSKGTEDAIDTLPKSLDDVASGQKIIDAKNNFFSTAKGVTDSIYGAVDDSFGDVKTPPTNTVQAIDEQIGQLSKSAGDTNKSIINNLSKIKNDLINGKNSVDNSTNFLGKDITSQDIAKMPANIQAQFTGKVGTYQPTYEVLKATKTSLGTLLQDSGIKGLSFNKIYDAIKEDKDAGLRTVNPEVADVVKDTDAYYTDLKNKMGSQVSQMINNSTPEKVVQNLIQGNNSTTLEGLKDIVDKETFANVGFSWIKNAVDTATDKVSGKIDINKFVKNLNSLDEPTKNALFTEDQWTGIQKVADTGQKLEKLKQTMSDNLGAGKFIRNNTYIRSLGIPFMMALGLPSYVTNMLIGLTGGEFVGAKLFDSGLGKSLFATGSEGITNAGQTIKNIGNIAGKSSTVSNLLKETQGKKKIGNFLNQNTQPENGNPQ